MESILVSWLGQTDLRAVTERDQVGIGPIAQALRTNRFARLELLCDYPSDEVEVYLGWLRPQTKTRTILHPVTLPSPTDFDAIYRCCGSVMATPRRCLIVFSTKSTRRVPPSPALSQRNFPLPQENFCSIMRGPAMYARC